MRVLGISPLDKDATASFLEDGRVLFACGEERLSRVKLQDGFPHRAVRQGLERLGWTPESIDHVGYAFFDGAGEARLMRETQAKDRETHARGATAGSLRRLRQVLANGYAVDRSTRIHGLETEQDEFVPKKPFHKRLVYDLVSRSAWLDWAAHQHCYREWLREAIADHERRTAQLAAGLQEYGLEGKLRRFNHHHTHAANAFFASGYADALVVTLDGYGSGNCGGIFLGSKEGLKPLHRFSFPNSLGQFYEYVTSALGFRAGRHEGKIVGLAAYGRPEVLRQVLRDRFSVADGEILMRAGTNYLFTRALAQRFAKRDVAAAYQRVLEEVAAEAVGYWIRKTGMRAVAVSGGVHANVKLNQRLREIEGVEQVFVYPNMGDGGCGTGAAMLLFDRGVFTGGPLDNVYFGPGYTDAEIEAALAAEQVKFERVPEIEERVAELLTANRIVGRFHGRMEYGPRALGNRSILYPAQDPAVNQWLNKQLGRTEFMPFAPAALKERGHELFRNLSGCEKTAEFMTITFDCTPEMSRMCPAAVHVDGTARPQLVSATSNAGFYKILKGYAARTGIPALINTSFNMHEEPIVCSPGDAVRAFLQGNIDYLAVGPYLAPHPRLAEIDAQRRR